MINITLQKSLNRGSVNLEITAFFQCLIYKIEHGGVILDGCVHGQVLKLDNIFSSFEPALHALDLFFTILDCAQDTGLVRIKRFNGCIRVLINGTIDPPVHILDLFFKI